VADAPNRSAPPSEPGSEIPRVDLGSGTRARGISAGGNHTCAVLEDGRVACWGGNEAGQLGLGHRIARVDASAEPAEAGLGFGAVALGVSAGAGHTCVLLADLRIKCFGINYHGALGQGLTSDARGDDSDELGDALSAVELGESGESSVGAVALSAGVDFTCAALDSELVKCWGANGSGQLGVGDTRSRGSNASDLGEALPPVALD
jgi:alpha-tubulin suppressor-like RCC1 family protein